MTRARRTPAGRLAAAAIAAALAVGVGIGPATPVAAQEPVRGAVNGWARASAAFVPFAVNPNFDFWPVYSFSEMSSSSSHGISAGFWPGFLVDATFFQFGYQPFERALFGAAESLWPNPPQEDDASTFDFAELCASGENARIAFPFRAGSAGFPEPMLTGCQSLWAQYERFWPYEGTRGVTTSDHLRSQGVAKGFATQLGDVTIGAARSATSTRVVGGATVSRAAVVLEDVAVGETLRIASITSTVRARSDGRTDGLSTERTFTIAGARYQDTAVEITDEGVVIPGVGPINDRLAEEGFDVRVIAGEERTTGTDRRAFSTSGALVIRMTRAQMPEQITTPANQSCESTAALREDAFEALGAYGIHDPIAEPSHEVGENPLHDSVFPYDQLPDRIEVQEAVPPAIPCLGLLLKQSADIGVVLGAATAEARLLPLPAIPPFDPGGAFQPGDGGFETPGGFTPLPGGPMGPFPSYTEVPPVPDDVFGPGVAVGALGPDVASAVKVLYGGLIVSLLAALAGRRVFRSLIRL